MASSTLEPIAAGTVFGLTAGVFGGLAQIILTERIGESKVKTSSVVVASAIIGIATFAAVFAIKKAK